jgi:hypothetical protein
MPSRLSLNSYARLTYLKNYNYRTMNCGRGSPGDHHHGGHLTGLLARYRSHVGKSQGVVRRRVDGRD